MVLRLGARLVALIVAFHAAVAPIGAQPDRPRLIALLVVDQMRGDYVDRFQHEWTGGLHRLLTDGAWFRQVGYPYFDTLTCPGHTSIATGTLPTVHGLVLNVWWDRRTRTEVRCTQDATASVVSYGRRVEGPGDSAANIRITTLGDELRAQSNGAARVVAFSLKAREAIPLDGRAPDAVTWFDDSGTWVTSSAFTKAPVPEVADFIRRHPIEARDYAAWQTSAASDEYLAQMALDVATQMHVERGDATNLIGISFSALDRVGHAFGPQSDEARQTLAHLDRTLATLFTGLDRLAGAGNYTVALLADHGVAPVPEQARAHGIDAGRVTPAQLAGSVEDVIRRVAGPGHYVAHVVSTHVYLEPGVFERLKSNGQLAAIRDAIGALPFVADAYTRDQIAHAAKDETGLGRIARSYERGRSGDITVVPRPYWIAYASPTTHGTAYGYDTRVPMVFMGFGVRPGQYLAPASPLDVAPTLALLAGVTLPQPSGRVLAEAVAPPKTSHRAE